MEIQDAYNKWAELYDNNENKTRDLEAVAFRETVRGLHFNNCLEIGCGTGKNTQWLLSKASKIVAVDLSEKMLEKAKAKVQSETVEFIQADINRKWDFAGKGAFDLVTFSLILEHIKLLDKVFLKLIHVVKDRGYVYIGELHPFKQYGGSKARFERDNVVQIVPSFNHHISDFTNSAITHGFQLVKLNEYFDDKDRKTTPRILALLLRRHK